MISTATPSSVSSISAASRHDAQHRAVGDQREVAALAVDVRAADLHHLGLVGHLFLRRVIERLRLEEDDRVGIADGGGEERARGARPRRDHHLEPGDVRVELLLALRVVLERAHAAAVRHADHHLAVEAALRALAIARGVVLDLMEALEREARELDLAHGLEPVERHADGGADDARLGEGAVDDALAAELAVQILRDAEDAAVHAHVLADDRGRRRSRSISSRSARLSAFTMFSFAIGCSGAGRASAAARAGRRRPPGPRARGRVGARAPRAGPPARAAARHRRGRT